MPDQRVDILVVGSGLCGLAIAMTAARRGFSVRCVGDARPGASLANFGQLHSGAVYAPVLPELAEACWLHRNRWHDLARPAQVGEPHGYALFAAAGAVNGYRDAWRRMGIEVEEVNPAGSRIMAAYPRPAVAFRIPDFSVDLEILYARTAALASGMLAVERRDVRLHRDPADTLVSIHPPNLRADLVVLATGSETPTVLAGGGITHPLRTRRIAWGRYIGLRPTCLTYWLDGDLLGVSPDSDSVRVGLPGVGGQYGTSEVEYSRIRAALDHHRIHPSDRALRLSLHWGTVCEPTNHHADPSSLVVDLRAPPAGWGTAANLIIALPGKWTTAWYCAERVIDAVV